ncbi:hypothetical protein RYX36_019066 [Vicia faba]
MPNGLDCTVNEINVTPSDNVAIPQELVNSSIVSSADVQCGRAANELTNNQNVPVIPLVCNETSNFAGQPTNLELPGSGLETPIPSDCPASLINTNVDVDMVGADAERNQSGQPTVFEDRRDLLLSTQNTEVTPDDTQAGQTSANNDASGTGTIDNRRNGMGFVRRPVKDQGLALAAPTVGIYLPCHDIFRNWFEEYTAKNTPVATTYVPLVAGSLARSLACATCYPIELAKTRMKAFKETQIGKKPPGVYQTLLGVVSNVKGTSNSPNSLQGYRALWNGMGAQLARDVPFSAICWSTLEPTRRKLISLVGGDDVGILSVLGANFSAGVVAGTLAAGATCPLDVAKTRRQIEMDHVRALKITLETCELN